MGVMSRRVLPVCAAFFCFTCPSLRPSSRKPTKRYKTLLQSIYGKDIKVKEKSMSKLCDYIEQNPDKLTKVLRTIEIHVVRDLAGKQADKLQVSLDLLIKLLSSCKHQMYMLAPKVFNVLAVLLDKRNSVKGRIRSRVQILSCSLFTQFTLNQVDRLYSFEIDQVVSVMVKMCDEKWNASDAAEKDQLGLSFLQAVTAAIWYGCQFSLTFSSFGKLVGSAVEALSGQCGELNPPGARVIDYKVPALEAKDLATVSRVGGMDPTAWASLCLYGLSQLSCEDSTQAPLVLGALLDHFRAKALWNSPLASTILKAVLLDMAATGSEKGYQTCVGHFLCSPGSQLSVSEQSQALTLLANTNNACRSTCYVDPDVFINSLSHLLVRVVQQAPSNASAASEDAQQVELLSALENCLRSEARHMIGFQSVLDMLIFTLGNLPSEAQLSSRTVHALVTLTRLISISAPRKKPQPFSENLFLHLIRIMTHHPQLETQVAAHHLLLALLAPSAPSALDSVGTPTISQLAGHFHLTAAQFHILLSSLFFQAKSPDAHPALLAAIANTFSQLTSTISDIESKLLAFQMTFTLRLWLLQTSSEDSGLTASQSVSLHLLTSSFLLSLTNQSPMPAHCKTWLPTNGESAHLQLHEDGSLTATQLSADSSLVEAEEEVLQRLRKGSEKEAQSIVNGILAWDSTLQDVRSSELLAQFVPHGSTVLLHHDLDMPLEVLFAERSVAAVPIVFQSPLSEFSEPDRSDASRQHVLQTLPSPSQMLSTVPPLLCDTEKQSTTSSLQEKALSWLDSSGVDSNPTTTREEEGGSSFSWLDFEDGVKSPQMFLPDVLLPGHVF